MNCREWSLIRGAFTAIRVKCSIMSVINAPFRGVEDSLSNSAYFSFFNFHFSIFTLLDYQSLGGGGVGGAEGEEVGAGGVL